MTATLNTLNNLQQFQNAGTHSAQMTAAAFSSYQCNSTDKLLAYIIERDCLCRALLPYLIYLIGFILMKQVFIV